jgi:hypothetical protein
VSKGGLQARNKILTRQRFNEHVNTLVPEFVSTGGEHVDGVFQVKVVVAVEVTTDEFVDLLLRHCVQVLEFVHGRELFHVETVGQDAVCELGMRYRFRQFPARYSPGFLLSNCSLSKAVM